MAIVHYLHLHSQLRLTEQAQKPVCILQLAIDADQSGCMHIFCYHDVGAQTVTTATDQGADGHNTVIAATSIRIEFGNQSVASYLRIPGNASACNLHSNLP